jgi:pterin-4-alpha-carbinolamine dehydratase (EC 4.2.1.96)
MLLKKYSRGRYMQREEAIVFRLKFKKYLDAVEFLRRVAEAAERLNHHPDVELRYVNLTLRLTTHDASNKVTEKDLRLAEEIQKIVEEFRDRLA